LVFLGEAMIQANVELILIGVLVSDAGEIIGRAADCWGWLTLQ
jgi:hypothetical protein